MRAEHIVTEDVVAALRVMTDPAAQPVLVHCKHGSDRTGVVVAAYRIVVQGWSKEDAIRELRDGGYGFHGIFFNIPEFLRDLDVAKVRQAVGVTAPEASPVRPQVSPAP
jgi:protein-tyrosine phosphatase